MEYFTKKHNSFIMANDQGFHLRSYGNWACYERCGKEDSTAEIRPSDQLECDSSWYEKDNKLNSDDPGKPSDEEMYDQYDLKRVHHPP